MLHIKKKSPWILDPCISPTILRAEEAGQAGVFPLIQPQLLYVCQRLTFIKVSAWHLSTYLIKYELSQKNVLFFFRDNKNVCFKVGAKKKIVC